MRQYKSRLNQIEEQKSVRTAIMYAGLTILILVGLLVFGFKLFPRVTNLFVKSSTEETNESINLVTPTLQSLAEHTNNQSIIVKGYSQPNSNVKIYHNSSSEVTTADDSGNFSINIDLTKGTNTIYAVTTDDSGNESEKSKTYTIAFSNEVPNLTINKPQNSQTFYGSEQNISVEGSTDVGNTVTINDHIAIIDSTGKFNYTLSLNNGENTIKIVSVSEAGNKKETELKVTYNP